MNMEQEIKEVNEELSYDPKLEDWLQYWEDMYKREILSMCFACHGGGAIMCEKCRGEGQINHKGEWILCHKCKGNGWIECRICEGKGIIN